MTTRQCAWVYAERGGQYGGQCMQNAKAGSSYCGDHEDSAVAFYRPDAPPMQAKETQKSISDWAVETFGETSSNYRIAVRMNKEMAELLDKLAIDDNDPNAIEEAADIIVVSMRLFERMGAHFWDAVETKMAINRAREWKRDGSGCGQHV